MADVNPLSRFLGKFTVLNGAARELWLTFALKFLNIAAYAVTNWTIKLWLSSEFGFSDEQALALVLAWSITMTAVTLLVGSLTDALGLRRTFFLGVGVCLVARLVMVSASNKWFALVGGLFPLAIGEALGSPVLVAAVRKYTTPQQRSISYSLIYMVMNVGFLVTGYLFDYVRGTLGEYGHMTLPVVGVTLPTYRVLFLVSWMLQLLMLPLVWLIRPGAEVTDEGHLQINPLPPTRSSDGMFKALGTTVVAAAKDTGRLFAGLFQQRSFYRLLAFLGLIAFLKLILMQMNYVFPTFGIRELGPGAPVGKLLNINSGLVIVLVPLVGAFTQRFPAYGMTILGSALTAGSVFVMAMPTDWFQSMAAGPLGHWLGYYLKLTGNINPYYVMIALYITIFSIGEAFYSPRIYEYAASIAPKGQEASYSALSYIPLLLGKILATTVSGFLLSTYCPEQGPRHPETMWLIVALMATVAPVGLIALRKVIRVKEAGRES